MKEATMTLSDSYKAILVLNSIPNALYILNKKKPIFLMLCGKGGPSSVPYFTDKFMEDYFEK